MPPFSASPLPGIPTLSDSAEAWGAKKRFDAAVAARIARSTQNLLAGTPQDENARSIRIAVETAFQQQDCVELRGLLVQHEHAVDFSPLLTKTAASHDSEALLALLLPAVKNGPGAAHIAEALAMAVATHNVRAIECLAPEVRPETLRSHLEGCHVDVTRSRGLFCYIQQRLQKGLSWETVGFLQEHLYRGRGELGISPLGKQIWRAIQEERFDDLNDLLDVTPTHWIREIKLVAFASVVAPQAVELLVNHEWKSPPEIVRVTAQPLTPDPSPARRAEHLRCAAAMNQPNRVAELVEHVDEDRRLAAMLVALQQNCYRVVRTMAPHLQSLASQERLVEQILEHRDGFRPTVSGWASVDDWACLLPPPLRERLVAGTSWDGMHRLPRTVETNNVAASPMPDVATVLAGRMQAFRSHRTPPLAPPESTKPASVSKRFQV